MPVLIEIPEVIHGRLIEEIKADLKETRLEAALEIFKRFETNVNLSLKTSALLILSVCLEDLTRFNKLKNFDDLDSIRYMLNQFSVHHTSRATDILKFILVDGKLQTGDPLLFSHLETSAIGYYNKPSSTWNVGSRQAQENLEKSKIQELVDLEMSLRVPRNQNGRLEQNSKIPNFSVVNDQNNILGQLDHNQVKPQAGILGEFMHGVGITNQNIPKTIQTNPDPFHNLLDFTRFHDEQKNRNSVNFITPVKYDQTNKPQFLPNTESNQAHLLPPMSQGRYSEYFKPDEPKTNWTTSPQYFTDLGISRISHKPF